jgi:hypothetical protein
VRKQFRVFINKSHRPNTLSELLTAQEACRRYGIRTQRLYALAELGLLHPVQPNGRILYPAWELEALDNQGRLRAAIAAALEYSGLIETAA